MFWVLKNILNYIFLNDKGYITIDFQKISSLFK